MDGFDFDADWDIDINVLLPVACQKSTKYSICNRSRLFEAIDDDQVEDFLKYFSIYSEANPEIIKDRDENGRTLLHYACEKGNIEIVKHLTEIFVTKKIPIMTLDNSQSTPIDLACVFGYNHVDNQWVQKDSTGHQVTYRYKIIKHILRYRVA